MLPGMVSALPPQDFYMPQGICGTGGLPPPAVQPQQQQSLMPMMTAAGGSGGATGQFDNFDSTFHFLLFGYVSLYCTFCRVTIWGTTVVLTA